jgi:hypothetical protein
VYRYRDIEPALDVFKADLLGDPSKEVAVLERLEDQCKECLDQVPEILGIDVVVKPRDVAAKRDELCLAREVAVFGNRLPISPDLVDQGLEELVGARTLMFPPYSCHVTRLADVIAPPGNILFVVEDNEVPPRAIDLSAG